MLARDALKFQAVKPHGAGTPDNHASSVPPLPLVHDTPI